jgi:hypothetical protein
MLSEYLPIWGGPLVLYTSFMVAQWENQRWVRARTRGMRGSNEMFGFFVDGTGFLSMIFGFVWIIAYAFDAGWRKAVGLFAVSWTAMFVIGMALSTCVALCKRMFQSDLSRRLDGDEMGGDWLLFWIAGTIAVWPLMIILTRRVSWFGLM